MANYLETLEGLINNAEAFLRSRDIPNGIKKINEINELVMHHPGQLGEIGRMIYTICRAEITESNVIFVLGMLKTYATLVNYTINRS